jgi:hypothetical protein
MLVVMRIRSGRSRTPVKSRARKPHDLLGIWLDLLKTLDDAPRRRAAKLRRAKRARRSIPLRIGSASACLSSAASWRDCRTHVDLTTVGVEAVRSGVSCLESRP